MSDLFGWQTGEAALLVEDDSPDGSLTTATTKNTRPSGQTRAALKMTPLDPSSLVRRIHDNFNWAQAFDPQVSIFPPVDLWKDLKPLWTKSNREFVTGIFEVLLGRAPEPAGLEMACAALADGASRFALARTVALSDEAAASQLDLSWLPHLDEVEPEAVWEKVQSLWDEPDEVFVAQLYPLLLVRPPEHEAVKAHCRAMRRGASRASVVRAFALSDEAQLRGIRISWLPRLEMMPVSLPPPPRLSFNWLKTAFRLWRSGKKSPLAGRPPVAQGSHQPSAATAEGRRA